MLPLNNMDNKRMLHKYVDLSNNIDLILHKQKQNTLRNIKVLKSGAYTNDKSHVGSGVKSLPRLAGYNYAN
jgi:hypothetical protein